IQGRCVSKAVGARFVVKRWTAGCRFGKTARNSSGAGDERSQRPSVTSRRNSHDDRDESGEEWAVSGEQCAVSGKTVFGTDGESVYSVMPLMLLTAHCPLLTSDGLLPTAYCLLLTDFYSVLPHLNATLNGSSFILLSSGYYFIR